MLHPFSGFPCGFWPQWMRPAPRLGSYASSHGIGYTDVLAVAALAGGRGHGANCAAAVLTGGVRPVTEVMCCVDVPVDNLACHYTDELFGELLRFDQPAPTSMVEFRRSEPTVGDRQCGSSPRHLVGELRPDLAECGVRDRTPECPPSHALLHGSEVEVFDDHLAVGVRQHRGELVGCLLAQVDAPPVEGCELGFRCIVSSGAGDASRKLPTAPAALGQCRPQWGGVGDFDDDAVGVGDGG